MVKARLILSIGFGLLMLWTMHKLLQTVMEVMDRLPM